MPSKKADAKSAFCILMKRVAIVFILILLLAACASSEETTEPVAATDVPTVASGQAEQTVVDEQPSPTSTANPTPSISPTKPIVATQESSEVESMAITQSAEFATSLPLIVNSESTTPTLAKSIELEEVAGGFEKLVYLTHAGDDRLFVVVAPGLIYIIENGSVLSTPFLDITDRVKDSGSEQGLLSAVFHPDYANNSRFFVYYTGNGDSVFVSEFSGDGNQANASKERILLTVAQPFRNHNGGQLKFGDDGYLYIGLGDGGSGGDPQNHGQSPKTLLGSILRIDVDNGEPYGIPADNPFVDNANAADEVWTFGWRNPWRFSFDRATGDMYIGDVGQNQWEEISFESADSSGGANYGWNVYEASHCYLNDCESILPDAVPPILEYDHGAGCSITGGYVYRGTALPTLNGNYLFADFCTGTVWASIQPHEMQIVLDSGLSISSFGEDAQGELYILHIGGTVYKIIGAE